MNFIERIEQANNPAAVKSIVFKAEGMFRQGYILEPGMNSISRNARIKIGELGEYKARGGVNTYKPHLSFSARYIGD